MSHTAVAYRRVLLQKAVEWPLADVDWTTVERATAIKADECLAPDFGSAVIRMAVGKHKQPLARTISSVGPDDTLLARYVRLLIQDASGDVEITLNDIAERYRPFWWGVVADVKAPRWSAATLDGISTGFATWTCISLLIDLDVHPDRGYEIGSDDTISVLSDPGELLGFNVEPSGDRSNITDTVGGREVYVHDRRDPAGTPWTARTAVDLLLASRTAEGGPPWQLSGQTDALEYSEAWALRGLTILQRINRILAPRRGIVVRPVVRAHIPYLHVTTTSPSAITVDAYTLPAALDQTDLDLRGQPFRTLTDFRIDARANLDVYDLLGKHPWLCRSFDYIDGDIGDLIAGWTPAEEAAWLAADAEGRLAPELAHVFRRFRLRDNPQTAWVNNVRANVTDATYGVAGEDGSQTADLAQGIAVNSIRFTRKLPLYEGLDYTGAIPTADPGTEFQDPKVFFREAGGNHIDVSDRFPIEVCTDEPAVFIGETPDHALELSRALRLGTYDLVVTVGLYEPLPLRVRWRQDPADWPRTDAPRRRSYPVDAELWRLAEDTVLIAGTTLATGGTILDERSRLRQALILGRSWVEFAELDLAWFESKTADVVDGFHPGAFINNLLSADGTDAVQQVITRREWDLTEGNLQTSYGSARIDAELRGTTRS